MRKTWTKRKKRKRTGASVLATAVSLSLFAAGLAVLAPVFATFRADAVVAGTVFRDPGFALAGAEVTVEAITLPPGVKKFKLVKVFSDNRGEYAVHVPAGQARYRVRVSAHGFVPEEKTADISAEERVDVYFNLKPASAPRNPQ
jgi:hypothetical protein